MTTFIHTTFYIPFPMRKLPTLCMLALSLTATLLAAQPGALDESSGTDGYVLDVALAEVNSLAVYPDGRIVTSRNTAGATALYMFLPDGSLDGSFGNGGILAPLGFFPIKVLLQPDGRILVGGDLNGGVGGQDLAVARYNADGTPDVSFGTAGRATVELQYYDYCTGMTLLDDGRVLLTGTWNIADSPALLVMFNPDGTMDTTFGTDGVLAWIPETGDDFRANDAAVQDDGAIVMVGRHGAQAVDDFIARFTPDGNVDLTFNGTGMLYLDFGANQDDLVQVELDTQGRSILLARSNASGSFHSGSLACVNTDGTLDLTFGTNGFALLNTASTGRVPTSFVIQDDGKLAVTGGTASDSSPARELYVSRYTADGELDSGFGDAGYTILALPQKEIGNAIVATTDGKLVVAGRSHITGEAPDLLLARFWQYSGLSVQETGSNGLRLFPLPCFDVLRVHQPANGVVRFTITDAQGRVALTGSLEPGLQAIPVSGLAPGGYVLELHTAQRAIASRFVKQ